MKFKDMVYERPNPDKIKEMLVEFVERLKSAETYEEAKKVFLEQEEESKHVHTMANLASIRNSINTKDEFYEKEKEFWDKFGAELRQYIQPFNDALLESPFRKDFEEEFGSLMFVNAEIHKRAFKP